MAKMGLSLKKVIQKRLKVSLHIRGLQRVFTPPETLHENALFALIDL